MAHKAETITAQLLSLSEPPPTAGMNGTPGAATTATAATPAKGATAGGRVIDQLAVATPNQINLRVRIAEVSVNALKELGITLGKTTGRFQFQTINPKSDLENAFQMVQPLGSAQSLTATLDALQQEGLATNLAEPNLTALSGQKASFLVGGEITIPGALTAVSTATTAGGNTVTQSTQQLAFGVRLDFTATILDADHIHLKLRPEISALDNATATVVGNTTIPGLDETIAETTVELASGQTFALAGLLRHDTNQQVSKVPGLGDIPVIGTLFRTTSYSHTDTEVVIVVTPYIVRPVLTALATPTDGFHPAHDLSQAVMGSMYRQTPPAPARGPVSPGGQGLVGTVGFRLD
jgi:pilus assembly protein CpaC